LTDNPYLRSLGVGANQFRLHAARIPGVEYIEVGNARELTFSDPDLVSWGLRTLGTFE
jgi:hypothetical protein